MSTSFNQSMPANGLSFKKLQFGFKRNVRLVMQNEANECGIACLTMIANYYGNGISLAQLRLRCASDGQGVNLKQIIEQANGIHLSARALKVPIDELNQLSCPAILHWDFSHFVVLCKVNRKGIIIADPAIGKRFVPMHEVDQRFTGVALELSPNQDFSKVKPAQGLRLRDFAQNIIGIKRNLALVFLLSLLLQIFALASPFYMQTVVDDVLVKADESLLLALALGFALLLIIDTFTQFVRERLMLHFSTRFSIFLSSSVFAHLLSLPMAYFMRRHIGDIVSRFESVQRIREMIASGIVTALLDGLLALITLAVLFLYSAKLACAVLVAVVLYTLLRWFLFYPIRRLNQEALHLHAEQQSFFMQSVRAIRTLKLNNSASQSHSKWLDKLSAATNKNIGLAQWNIHFSTLNKLLFGIENLVIIYLAALLVLEQSLSVGMLFAFMSYKSRFIESISRLVDTWIDFKLISVHLERVSDVVLEAPELPRHISKSLPVLEGAIKNAEDKAHKQSTAHIVLKNISYRYGKDAPLIFSNINLTIKRGESIAITGPSGCGKSTLMYCLSGLLSPSSGQIEIEGRILSAENRGSFGIAAVMQDDQLLSGSILENIAQFDTRVDVNRVVACAQAACLHDDIMRMTMQYQSTIGDMGDALSGGQKQRLLIARALYKRPQILLLDEASSHLDEANEQALNTNLQSLNITKIMIAHRRATIESAQHIIELDHSGVRVRQMSRNIARYKHEKE
uniref:peptidase domain-containing ABC transporter n=1 Tax=Ningiella ruwaisensis TaxID=2364274 RepID=UPI00109FF41A|nr:peptidase domain-containing ABC transporter [Ningiella ruwaisensis]